MGATLNMDVAAKLAEAAAILENQGANPFRAQAYRRAADTISGLDESVAELFRRAGLEGLMALPGIGESIAAAVAEMMRTGRWSRLERLRGTLDPEALFQVVPGIGPELARRIHDELAIDTLEALEVAAHDGRLERVAGMGPRRTASIRAVLAQMLGRLRSRPLPAAGQTPTEPTAAMLLDVDREYREKATAGALPTIAPKRFNPEGRAWLPILHSERDDWHFTALFSNTARAHELKKTRDWVVIYFYDRDHREGQRTVVTESRGPLAGRRVVRGRESECPAVATERARAAI